MKQAWKVGRKKNMINKEEAISFGEKFLENAKENSDINCIGKNFKLADKIMKVYADQNTITGELIFKAFLKSDFIEPHYTIHIWNSSFPSVLPNTTWARVYIEQNKVIPFQLTQPYRIFLDDAQGMIYVYNEETKIGAIWLRNQQSLDLRSFITPFRLMISWIAQSFNGEVVHASAVTRDNNAFILSGKAGSGKSSMALNLTLKGFSILSDDAVIISNGNVYAIYNHAKTSKYNKYIKTEGMVTFELPGIVDSKTIIDLESSFSKNFSQSARLAKIIYPIIAEMSCFQKISSQTSLKLLATNSLREIFGGDLGNLKRLTDISRKFPAYRLALSGEMDTDLDQTMNAIND